MGKPKTERRLSEDEAMAKGRMIRTSQRKLNLLAQLIRGKKAETALSDLTFSRRRVSEEVIKVLRSAIANAENNHSLDIDDLYVKEAWTGKNLIMKRFQARGRGKSSGIEKPFSELTIVLSAAKREVKPKVRRAVPEGKRKVKPGAKAPAARAQGGTQTQAGEAS